MLSIRNKVISLIGLWVLFHSVTYAQELKQKKISELKEGSVICYFTSNKTLTQSKANSHYYRKLIKKDAGKGNGSYIIQDFFSKTGKKQVDPVILMDVKDLCSFSVSRIDGYYVQWYSNGNKEVEATYNKDILQGKYTTWYETGKLKSESFYDKGKLNGVFTSWTVSGVKVLEASYRQGKLNGTHQQWYHNGSKDQLQEYKNGVRHGRYIEWRNDEPVITGSYKEGQRDSTWTWRDVNGNKVKEGMYKEGNEEGLWTIWDNSGNKRQEINYKKGSYDGLVMRWDNQGNLYVREMYEHGRRIWRKEPFSLKGL